MGENSIDIVLSLCKRVQIDSKFSEKKQIIYQSSLLMNRSIECIVEFSRNEYLM